MRMGGDRIETTAGFAQPVDPHEHAAAAPAAAHAHPVFESVDEARAAQLHGFGYSTAMRTTIAAAIVAVSLTAACSQKATPQREPLPPDQAAELLHQRIWLDKEPRGQNDVFHLFVFDEGQLGIYQDRTIWKGKFEMFIYEAEGKTIEMRLPGSRKIVKTSFTVEKSKRGEADVKLTLDKPFEGPKEYYGYRFDGEADAFVQQHFGDLK
jgi:hypothetical protein